MSLRRGQKLMAARTRRAVVAVSGGGWGRVVVDTFFYCNEEPPKRAAAARIGGPPRNGGGVSIHKGILGSIMGACSGVGSAVISITSFVKRVVIHVLRNLPGSCLKKAV